MNSVCNLVTAFALFEERYAPKILAEVNDTRVMLVKLDGSDVPWHTHAQEDELFMVFKGSICIHLRHESHFLKPGDLYVVPRGVEHKVISFGLSEVVLLESKTVKHTGDVPSQITREHFEYLTDEG